MSLNGAFRGSNFSRGKNCQSHGILIWVISRNGRAKMTDYFEKSLIMHQQLKVGGIHNKIPIGSRDDLSVAYTPVWQGHEVIAEDPEEAPVDN